MEMQMMDEDNNKTTTQFNFKTPQQKAQAVQQQRKPPNGNNNNQNNFMDDPNCMEEMYQFMEELGSGGFGKVKLAVHNLTGERVAVKIIDKKAIGSDLPRVTSELEALKHLAHQNICRMFQFVETEEKYFIVMEFCNGGEMFDYIVRKERLGESEARHFFRQLVQAVAYIHSMGFAHRDLKPENLLLTQDLQLKVIDFGLCAKPLNGLGRPLDTCCGSPAYAAPELIQNSSYYGNEADIWSMGVLLYALLCGNLPFDDTNLPRLYKQILAGVYFEPPYLSELAKDFLRSMLTVDAKRRATIRQILGHPWLNKNYEQQLKWQTIYSREVVDEEVLRELVYFHRVDRGQMEAIVREWHFDYGTATYLILLQRKERKQNFALPFNYDRLPLSPTIHSSLGHDLDLSGMEAAMATANSSTGHSTTSTSNASDEPLVTSMGEKLNKLAMDPLLVLRKGASPQNGHSEGGKPRPMSMLVNALGPRVLPAHQQQQQYQQRPTTAPGTRTTGPPPLNYYNLMQGEGGGSSNSGTAKSVYTTPRRAGGTVTPRAGGTVGRMVSPVLYRRPTSVERPNHPALADPKTPASSQQNGNVGQRLPSAPPIRSNSTDQAVMVSNNNSNGTMTLTTTTSEPLTLTPLSNERVARRDTKHSSKQQRGNNNNFEQDNNSGKAKPGKSPSRLRQRVFSSLERKADKMINLLTPKRVRSEAPTKLKCIKAMVNVSVTSSEDPKQVLDELWKVLHEQGMETTQNGWKICGSKKGGAFGSTTTVELEVVVIEGLQYVGVKRKRIQGDSFMYKRICEEVLLLAGL